MIYVNTFTYMYVKVVVLAQYR